MDGGDAKEEIQVPAAPLTMFPLTKLSSVAEAYADAESLGLDHLESVPLPVAQPFVVEELGRVRSPKAHYFVLATVLAGWAAWFTSIPECIPCRACTNAQCTVMSYNEDNTVTVVPDPPITVENVYRARVTPKLVATSAAPGSVLPCFYTLRSDTITFHVPSVADTRPWPDQCPARFVASVSASAVFALFACMALTARHQRRRLGRTSCVFPPGELCVVMVGGIALVLGTIALLWW